MTDPRQLHAFRPTILAVDDSKALRRMEGELRKLYEADYRVVCEGLPEAALEKLRGYEQAGEEVALVLAAQWMAGTTSVGFLVRAHQVFSGSGRNPTARPSTRWSGSSERDGRDGRTRRGISSSAITSHTLSAADSEAGRALLGEVGAADRLPVWVLFDGQAAMHLSNYASSVMLLVRGGSLEASMSDYLIREIEASTKVEVRLNTRVVGGVTSPHCTRRVLPSSCPASPPKQIEHEDGRSYQHEDT